MTTPDASSQKPEAPYQNLILTGYMGTGKTNVGRLIARQLGVMFIDLETEIQLREGSTVDEIRALFGESRLRTLEFEICREISLRRGAVLSVNGSTLLDETNRNRLLSSGPVLVLTCTLNEILRRLHAAQGAHFHDPKVRATALNQIRREQGIRKLSDLPTLDTTRLTAEQIAEKAIVFWRERDIININR